MKGTNLPSTLTSMFRNIALLTHFLRQRFSHSLPISLKIFKYFKNIFPIVSQVFSRCFSNLYISLKFFQLFLKTALYPDFSKKFLWLLHFFKILPKFSKNYCKIFPYSKISPETSKHELLCITPVLLDKFFKISSQLITI